MATVALWHLALTAVLAGVLLAVIVVQSVSDLVHRLRPGARRAVPVPQQRTTTVETTPEPVVEPEPQPVRVEPRRVSSDADQDAVRLTVPLPVPDMATVAGAR